MCWATLLDVGLERALHIREEHLSTRRDACRVVYISDIHLRPRRSVTLTKRVVEAATQSRPDMILLGGDLVDRRSELGELQSLVCSLGSLAPVLAVGGNHDFSVGLPWVRDAVLDGGGRWIHEESVLIPHRARIVAVSGPNATAAQEGHVRILCAHNPRIWKRVRQGNFDLVLAGHLHGCQVVAFQYRDRLFPGAWFYPYCFLSHQTETTRLVVSRGVSDLLPVRWSCPREIVLCHV